MSKSDYLENEILDHVLGAATFTPPATIYIALFTATPDEDGTGGTEVSGNGYARASVTNNLTNWPAAAGGAKSNGAQIDFPTPSGSWGEVVAVGLYDAATNGNLLYVAPLTLSKTIQTGDPVYFPVGALDFTEN